MKDARRFYVYLHIREDNGQCFYVGKGCAGRAHLISSRNERWQRVFKKAGRKVVFAKQNMPEACAGTLERMMIWKYRQEGDNLINVTDGGGGLSGCKHPGRKVVYSSLDEKFDCLLDAEKHLRRNGFPKASLTAISKCASGIKHTAYGRAWSYLSPPLHPVKTGGENRGQHNIRLFAKAVITNTGLQFPSVRHAARWLVENGYPRAAPVAISRSCKGISAFAYGFVWAYVK